MTPEQIDRVFGRGRLRMATGDHVEVFREAVAPGERRRYTKRFLRTGEADFGQWTEREWRILARLIGHGVRRVPDVVQFDGGAMGGMRLVQTYDAGVTVDQWATLLPVSRNGALRRHAFEDCAHWWALAHHCLAALDEIHALELVHLDVKGDNICIPYGPASFDPDASGVRLYPVFGRLALIDFAFSLVSRESLSTPLPIGWQKDYDYQSPRLLRALDAGRGGDLQPTRELDWRCDMYSLAAMLKRYLPVEGRADTAGETGWTPQRCDDARTLIFRLRECHDRDLPHWRPHPELMDFTGARIAEHDLAASLDYGWTLARDATAEGAATLVTPITPMTRIAPSVRPARPHRLATPIVAPTATTAVVGPARVSAPRRRPHASKALVATMGALVVLAAPSFIGDPTHPLADRARDAADAMRSWFGAAPTTVADAGAPQLPSRAPEPARESPRVDGTAAPAAETAAPAAEPAAAATPDGTTQDAAPAAESAPEAPSSSSKAEEKPPTPVTGTARAKKSAAAGQRQTAPRPSSGTSGAKTARTPAYASASGRSSARPAAAPVAVAASSTPPSAPEQDARSAPTPAIAEPAAAETTRAEDERRAIVTASAAPSIAVETSPAPVEPRAVPPVAPATRSAPNPPKRNDFRAQLDRLFRLLRPRDEPPAPVEERSVPTASAAFVARPAAVARSPSDAAAQPNPRPGETAMTLAPAVPLAVETWVQASPVNPAPLATPPAPIVASRLAPARPTSPAPAGIPPPMIADARASAPPGLAPAAMPPVEPRRTGPWDAQGDDYALQGRRMLADYVPRVAAQAQQDVSRVLWIAALANQPAQRQAVIDAVYATWPSETGWMPAASYAPMQARRLHDDARQAVATGRNVSEAIGIELRAFGANPRDPDIAGYLAFLHLRMNPAQPETARQLALHAIAISSARRSTRPDDWGTLAVASALTGRESDAARAFQVEIALTSNPDRSCQAALNAYSSFGERLRVPVQALLQRARAQGRGYESPACAWPAYWAARSP